MSQSKLPSALKTYSVLPDNQSGLERALEISLSAQVYGIDNPYPQLLDARNTSNAVVPYLAAERQLPVWDVSDADHVKRSLAGNAWQVRRLSGTRAGLKLALDSFDFMSELKAWHQQDPVGEPYSLEIIAWEKGNKPINVDNVHKLIAYIDDTKSERDNIELSLVFGVETSIGMAGAIAPAINSKRTDSGASIWPMPDAVFNCAIAGAASAGTSINQVNAKAVVSVITGCCELNITAYAAHTGVTVSDINARAIT